jgi:hypothetical protein
MLTTWRSIVYALIPRRRAICVLDSPAATRRRHVASRAHPIPELVQVVLEVLFELLHRLPGVPEGQVQQGSCRDRPPIRRMPPEQQAGLPRAGRGPYVRPLSTSFKVVLDALPAVHSFVRLSDPYLMISRIAFSVTFTTPAVVPAQLTAVCSLPLRGRLRRAYLHHQRSMALVLRYLHRFTAAFVAQTLFEPACQARHERLGPDPRVHADSSGRSLTCRPVWHSVGSSRLQASLSALLVFACWEAELTGLLASRSLPGHV